MKAFVVSIFIVGAFFIQEHECLLKTTKIEVVTLNTLYANSDTLQVKVQPLNATYNFELFHWNLATDLPADIALRAKIYVLDSDGNIGREITDVTISVCRENRYRQYLTNFLTVPKEKLNLNKPCILKGDYHYLEVGQVKLEGLIPNLKDYGTTFLIKNTLFTNRDYIVQWDSVQETVA